MNKLNRKLNPFFQTGKVTLSACIINEEGRCGSVAILQHIKHAVSAARKVMESSPHVMMAGGCSLPWNMGLRKKIYLPNKNGEYRGYAIQSGYSFAARDSQVDEVINVSSI